MLNFFKENSYTIFKMFVNQIGMTIFGLALSMPTSQNDTLLLLSSVFSMLFYLVLLYTMTWDIGYEEKIRIEGKRLRFIPLKGLYMSLFANLPNLLLGLLMLVGFFAGGTAEGGPVWAINLVGVCKAIVVFLEGMYNGIVTVLFGNAPWACLLIVLPALVTCTLAYLAGVKGFRIFPSNPKKQNRE